MTTDVPRGTIWHVGPLRFLIHDQHNEFRTVSVSYGEHGIAKGHRIHEDVLSELQDELSLLEINRLPGLSGNEIED